MNLSHLRFANALAASGSFTAAAAECFVTQPALSNGIAQLEDELGGRLFSRTTRKVALTPFGTHLLPCIGEVVRAQATLTLQARAFLKPERRLIRIGLSPVIDARLPGLIGPITKDAAHAAGKTLLDPRSLALMIRHISSKAGKDEPPRREDAKHQGR